MSVYEDESLTSGSQQRVPKERFDEVNSAAKFYKEQFERAGATLVAILETNSSDCIWGSMGTNSWTESMISCNPFGEIGRAHV